MTYDNGKTTVFAFNFNSYSTIRSMVYEGKHMLTLFQFDNKWYELRTYESPEEAEAEANNIIDAFEHGLNVYRIGETIKDKSIKINKSKRIPIEGIKGDEMNDDQR